MIHHLRLITLAIKGSNPMADILLKNGKTVKKTEPLGYSPDYLDEYQLDSTILVYTVNYNTKLD